MDNLVRLRDLEGQYDLRNFETDLHETDLHETDLHETKTNFLKRSFKYSTSILHVE